MVKPHMGLRAAAGCLLVWGGAAPAWAASVADVLQFRPKQPGIACSTPTPQEEAGCKLDWVPAKAGKGGTYVLRDAKGQLLRRFVDTNGDNRMDVWSYFKDGVEVYRETDTDLNGKPDQYRWLNGAGMKWGVDQNEDGRIDSWKQISVEEVGQELVQALVAKDLARLQALLITEADVKALELPAAEATRLRDLRNGAAARFQAALGKLTHFTDKTRLLHLETAPPACVPADQAGPKYDLVKHPNVTVLCDTGGKTEWLQTGEVIQVGPAWRLVDAPTVGIAPAQAGPAEAPVDKELQALYEQLAEHDKKPPASPSELPRYHLQRVDLLDKIVLKVEAKDREARYREIADGLGAAAQGSPAGDKAAYERLQRLEDQVVKNLPAGHPLAAYVTYREMQADYAAKLNGPNLDKVQADWLERLAKFVKTYPQAEDAPDALLQLGMVSEFVGKEVEAKNWYQQLAQNHADKPAAAKAKGAVKRLELEGKTLELAGPQLTGGAAFDVAKLRGKVVVVYYWASWNQQCLGDFAKLKLLLDDYGPKGLELVCVNLDNTADEANTFLKKSPAPGLHLFQANDQGSGLDSPPAVQYGIMVLPNLFLADKDGKVVSRTVQVGNLADELKKLLR